MSLLDFVKDGGIVDLRLLRGLDFHTNAIKAPPDRLIRGGVDHFILTVGH